MNTNALSKSIKFGIPSSKLIDNFLKFRNPNLSIKYFVPYELLHNDKCPYYIFPIASTRKCIYFFNVLNSEDYEHAITLNCDLNEWFFKRQHIKEDISKYFLFYDMNFTKEYFEDQILDVILGNDKDLLRFLLESIK